MAVAVYGRGFWGVGDLLGDHIETNEIKNSVFFLTTFDEMSYGSGLVAMNLWDFESNENIFVKDLGDESNAKYMHYMNGKEFYRVTYIPWKDESVHPAKIVPVLPEDVLHVEMEDKFPPFLTETGTPDYCNVYPVREHVYPYLGFPKMRNIAFSRGQALYCRFDNQDQRYTFGQYFPEGGTYEARLAALSGPLFGDLDIFVDDRLVGPLTLDRQSDTLLSEHHFRFDVSRGLHRFRIAPHSDNLPARNYFMIDFIRFELVRDDG
jgi:hypothetical protein